MGNVAGKSFTQLAVSLAWSRLVFKLKARKYGCSSIANSAQVEATICIYRRYLRFISFQFTLHTYFPLIRSVSRKLTAPAKIDTKTRHQRKLRADSLMHFDVNIQGMNI